MDLRFEKVLTSKRKREIKDIYISSFPKNERMPFPMMVAMSALRNTEFFAFYDGDTLCGFLYMASMADQTFVMFFAVAEKLRSKGYGSAILSKLSEIHPENKLIISIEPCCEDADNLEQRLSRKKFYLRNGYSETGYMMRLLGQDQEILIKNGSFGKGEFLMFFLFYSCFAAIPIIKKI